MIAYCWAEKSGYSKFDSYSGSTSEITVYTTDDGTSSGTNPFKPAFVLIKRTDSNPGDAYWVIFDNTRDVEGDNGRHLFANLSNAESDSVSRKITFNDNGFTIPASASADGSVNAGSGTYIYAAFADTREAAFWLDQSTNNNDWQPDNLDHNDTLLDSPTDNFATLNPLNPIGSDNTYSDGNLKAGIAAQNAPDEIATATMGFSSGQHYWETTILSTTAGDGGYLMVGLRSDDNASYWLVRGSDGEKNDNGTTGSSSVAYDVGDTVRVAVDMDAGKWWVGVNENWVGDPSAGTGELHSTLTGTVLPNFQNASSAGTHTATFNFGQQPFKYDPPA